MSSASHKTAGRLRLLKPRELAHVPTPAPGVRFSDNYLDLRPGEPREIEVRGLTEHTLASLRVLPYAGLSEGS